MRAHKPTLIATSRSESAHSPAEALRLALTGPCVTRAPVVVVHSARRAPELTRELAGLDDARIVTLCICQTSDPLGLATELARAYDTAVDARDQLAPLLDQAGAPAFVSRVTGRDARLRVFEAIRQFIGVLAASQRTIFVLTNAHKATADVAALIHFLEADALSAPAVAGAATLGRRAALVLTSASETPDGRRLLGACDPRSTRLSWGHARSDQLSDLLSPEVTARLAELVGSREHGADALAGLLPQSLDELYSLRLSREPAEAHRALYVLDQAACAVPLGALASLATVDRFSIERLRHSGLVSEHAGQCALPAWAAAPPVELDLDTRASLELRVAEHLEKRFHTTGDTSCLLRACELWTRQRATEHVVAASGVTIPVATLVAAALDLSRRGAPSEAHDILTRALSVVSGDAQRPLHLALADIAVDRGDVAAALSHVRNAAHDDDALGLRLAKLESATGDTDRALELLNRVAAKCSEPALGLAVRAELAEVHLRRGELDTAERIASEALAQATVSTTHASRPAISELAHDLEHTLIKIVFWRGRYPEAKARFEALLGRLPRGGSRLASLVAHNLGLVGLRTGANDDAVRRLQLALHGFERQGDHFEAAVCLHNLGIAYEHGQRYAHAASMFERSIDLFERFGTAANLIGAVTSLADLYLTIGETWRARRLLDHASSRAEAANLPYLHAFATLRLASASLLDGEFDSAAALATGARATFTTLGHVEERAEAELLLGELGDADSLTRAASLGSPEIVALAQVAMAAREPSRPRAIALLEAAAETLERIGERTSAARAYGALTEALARAGQRRAAEQARERARALIDLIREHVPVESRPSFDALPWVATLGRVTFETSSGRVVASPLATNHHGLVGDSSALARVREIIDRVAPTSAPVLITGESGTGKELVAEAIWRASPRSHRPLVRVNAAAFVDTLLESELFGHEKGAFTGASARKLGAFEQANGGTLFLDEIGDISAKTQVSLLRVLQNGDVRRVGGTEPIRVDVRIVCATNRDLGAMVANGTFRLDLYYRIRGVELALPALRDRSSDLDLLTEHLLARLGSDEGRSAAAQVTVAPEARALLARHDWPGNVRELENVIRSAFFFARDGRITADDLLTYTTLQGALAPAADADFDDIESDAYPAGDGAISSGFDLNDAKRKLELRCIERALEQAGGNISKAAQLLGLKRPRLSQKIKEYGLKEPG